MLNIKFAAAMVALVVCFVAQANPEDPKLDWKKVPGLTVRFLEKKINNENCNESQAKFLGCVQALNDMMILSASEKEKPHMLVNAAYLRYLRRPRADLSQKLETELITDFGSAQIHKQVQEAKPVGTSNLLNTKRRTEALQAAWKESWLAIYDLPQSERPPFDRILAWIADTLVPQEDREFVIGMTYNSYIHNGEDAHGRIEPLVTHQRSFLSTGDNFTGIGAEVRLHTGLRKLMIVNVFEGSGADEAGLLPNDILLAVDGTSLPESVAAAVGLIRGPAGTKITLDVQRRGEVMPVVVTRKLVQQDNVATKIYPMGNGQTFGQLIIRTFMQKDLCIDVAAAVIHLQANRVAGIAVDLRSNPGGSLEEVKCILGLFIGKNKPVLQQHLVNKDSGQKDPRPDLTTQGQIVDVPVVVLVNSSSASGSEVFSGVIQDAKRGVVLGIRTFGKGTVITTSPSEIPGLLVTKTTSVFYLPGRDGKEPHTNQAVGIRPDIEVYEVPNPRKVDMLTFREADYSSVSLHAEMSEPYLPYPELGTLYKACMALSGTAKSTYDRTNVKDRLARDYQLLVARDALACSLQF